MASFENAQQEEEEDVFCTFALTKTSLVYQGIYICTTCSSKKKKTNECCCAGCADVCHAGHDVRLLAYGNGYCDCGEKGPTKCSIIGRSMVTAEHFMPSLHQESGDEPVAALPVIPLFTQHNMDLLSSQDFLVEQCVALVRQSKETFWLGNDSTPRCALEQLAKSIGEYHWQRLGVNAASGGIEWWIQVKADGGDGKQAASIDLHYDKDEKIAELFTLGFFPLLSSVSYLTQSQEGAAVPQIPTLILDATASAPVETTPIRSIFVSYPRVGKHIAFRGDLLHGAPKQWLGFEEAEAAAEKAEEKVGDQFEGPVRVTFLVNLWTHRPADVERLPEPLVASLAPSPAAATNGWPLSPGSEPERVEVTPEEALDPLEASGKYVNIPFIEGQTQAQEASGGEAVGDEDEEDEEDEEQGLYCLAFVPRRTQRDSSTSSSGTFVVQYLEDEIAATLQYEEQA